MDYKDQILANIGEIECERICRKTIRTLQSMTEGMQSGDDTPLKNLWDEVCVQIQSGESVMWDAYLHTIESIIFDSVNKLKLPIKQAIWLLTQEGMQWEDGDGDLKGVPYCEVEITAYILNKFVFANAADWNNKRIREYLDKVYAFD